MTTLRLYNTLTKTKEDFAPIDPTNVRMYVCGPTVYDYAHIGNARPVIVFDVLFRLLRHIYGVDHVTYVRNITDVDDKINARAAAEGISIRELTEKTARQYDEDVAALGCLPPTVAPRATDNIAEMIAMIQTLIQHGNAYVAEGHVLFDVSSKHDYGKLSRRTVDDMIAGARIDVAPYKKNPMDFVMWKPSDAATPGWESPWGRGRPGWHIECSAMSARYLGETFDIHGGGIDLQFPHHENEIAQSEGAHHGRPFANVWMHNGFLEVEGAKMSKSLGNFVTINELLGTKKFGGRSWNGDVLRFAMLQTQYRQPIDWTVSSLEQAKSRLDRWRQFASERTQSKLNFKFFGELVDALSDDLNTPKAFSLVDEVVSSAAGGSKERYTIYKFMRLLGFKGPSSISAELVKKVKRVEKAIPTLGLEDWQRAVEIASTKPSGPLERAAVSLVGNTATLESAFKDIESIVRPISQLTEIVKIGQERETELREIFVSHSATHREFVENVKRINRELRSLNKLLSQMSKNDWTSIIENVRENPLLNSGDPKAATDLLANVLVLQNSMSGANNVVQDASSLVHVTQWREKFFPKIENDHESRIQNLVDARLAARKAKDFKESDRIRDELLAQGIVLKDGPQGTTWEVKK